MMSVLYKTNTLKLDLYSASSLKQQPAGKHVPSLGPINQSLLFLPNDVCFLEKQQIQIV
jgi:hypothetical protein